MHQPKARDKDVGHWKPARHVPLEYAARHGSVTERPRASPSCSAQTKPQFRFHPPGLHPQPGQRDKASRIPTGGGQRLLASPLAVRGFGGPCLPPPCPQAAAMFCQSAGERGAARGVGIPEVLRGAGLERGLHPPTHPLTPQRPCPPSPAPRGATGPSENCGSGVAARDSSPWDPSPQQQVMCRNHRPARLEGRLGFDPCPAQPLKPRTFQIQKRVEENETDRGFHFSLGSHLFNPLLLLLDSTEMGSNHQNPGTTGAAHRQGPGPGLSSHSTMEITRFRLR